MLSDLYAMGVTDCDNMLMLLGVSNKMSEKERDVVVPMMMRGFKVCRTIFGNHILSPRLYAILHKKKMKFIGPEKDIFWIVKFCNYFLAHVLRNPQHMV